MQFILVLLFQVIKYLITDRLSIYYLFINSSNIFYYIFLEFMYVFVNETFIIDNKLISLF